MLVVYPPTLLDDTVNPALNVAVYDDGNLITTIPDPPLPDPKF
jgi:hypothetical protein